jgi:hypothetical protein
MLPRDNGDLGLRLADYRRTPEAEPDLLGYSLIAASVAIGVMLAIVFAAF